MFIISAIFLSVFCRISTPIELPAGLRPAKALGEPLASGQNPSDSVPSNVRTPPNLSLRSRMIAALNPSETSAASGDATLNTAENNDGDAQTTTSAAQKPPVVFQKSGRKAKKPAALLTSQVTSAQQINIQPSARPHQRIVASPPKGKNYGVNTLLQTNLVDSKGRVIKGVNSVPIRLPSSAELRNAKTSRASASQVETDAEKVVPVEFGRAQRHKYF